MRLLLRFLLIFPLVLAATLLDGKTARAEDPLAIWGFKVGATLPAGLDVEGERSFDVDSGFIAGAFVDARLLPFLYAGAFLDVSTFSVADGTGAVKTDLGVAVKGHFALGDFRIRPGLLLGGSVASIETDNINGFVVESLHEFFIVEAVVELWWHSVMLDVAYTYALGGNEEQFVAIYDQTYIRLGYKF